LAHQYLTQALPQTKLEPVDFGKKSPLQRGFKPHPLHRYVEKCGVFMRTMLTSVFAFSEDLIFGLRT
jgi:hypothetical protein